MQATGSASLSTVYTHSRHNFNSRQHIFYEKCLDLQLCNVFLLHFLKIWVSRAAQRAKRC